MGYFNWMRKLQPVSRSRHKHYTSPTTEQTLYVYVYVAHLAHADARSQPTKPTGRQTPLSGAGVGRFVYVVASRATGSARENFHSGRVMRCVRARPMLSNARASSTEDEAESCLPWLVLQWRLSIRVWFASTNTARPTRS